MNKLMFIVAAAVIAFIGWLYNGEMSDVAATKAAVTAAADKTAVTLSQAREPERNTDAEADGIFKKLVSTSALDDLAVRQSVQTLAPGHFRQSVTISARARTKLSEFFNMQGAVIEVEATRDFERSN